MEAVPSRAWNLLFEIADGVSTNQKHPGARIGPLPDDPHDGWFGTAGPAIQWRHWPRSLSTGLPLMHVLTLRLPEEYRRKGPDHPGIAYFAECGDNYVPHPVRGDAGSDDPFLVDLAEASDHPMLSRRTDILRAEHAIIWLTDEELLGGPVDPPADPRRPGEHVEGDTYNAWDDPQPHGRIWLVPRTDPNTGFVPRDHLLSWGITRDGYQNPYSEGAQLVPWASELKMLSHLGGTPFPVNDLPDGLTPWYLELEEIGELNYGGGNAQIDLESDVLDWSC